jgi:hypothetical protein
MNSEIIRYGTILRFIGTVFKLSTVMYRYGTGSKVNPYVTVTFKVGHKKDSVKKKFIFRQFHEADGPYT